MPDAPTTRPRRIRTIAIGVVVLHDHLLLGPVDDSVKRVRAYRPLGGGVDFGERAAGALVREFKEETGRRVEIVELIEVGENLFTFEGAPGHEIVFTYHARFVPEDEPADLSPLPCEEDNGERFEAVWLPLAEVLGGMHTVYPEGFADTLARWINRM